MANKGTPNSNGSQFFIILDDLTEQGRLSPDFTLFGQIKEGHQASFNTLAKIEAVPVGTADGRRVIGAAAGDHDFGDEDRRDAQLLRRGSDRIHLQAVSRAAPGRSVPRQGGWKTDEELGRFANRPYLGAGRMRKRRELSNARLLDCRAAGNDSHGAWPLRLKDHPPPD